MTKHYSAAKLKSRFTRQSNLIKGLLLTLLISAIGLYFYKPSANDSGKPQSGEKSGRKFRDNDDAPVPVALETAIRSDFDLYLNAIGTVTAQRTVTVRSRVDGQLLRVAFKEGQWLKEGELLAEIDPRPFQIQLQQTEGQLLRDQALLNNAMLDHQRYQTLLAQDSIAAQQTAMQASLVKQYQGNVAIDKAQVENAKLQLVYAKLTAPIAGQAGLRQVDQGNIIHANDAGGLVMITQLQPIDVVFTLPEDKLPAALGRWRANPDIKVEAFDRSGKIRLAEGRLKAIDNQIDPSTGTIKLKAQFDNHEQTLFANQFVNIRMLLDTLKTVIQIPSTAILHDNEGPYVFVARADHSVEQRRISLGPVNADKTVVLGNIEAGEALVTDGLDRLKPGSKIDIARRNGVAADPEPEPKPTAATPGLRHRSGT